MDRDGTVTLEETLDPQRFGEFAADLSGLSPHTYWNDPADWMYGSAVRITLRGGSVHMINHCCSQHRQGEDIDYTRHYYDAEEFQTLWTRYCSADYRHV